MFFNIKVNALSALLKMSSIALLAAIPRAVMILSRMVNPSTYQDWKTLQQHTEEKLWLLASVD